MKYWILLTVGLYFVQEKYQILGKHLLSFSITKEYVRELPALLTEKDGTTCKGESLKSSLPVNCLDRHVHSAPNKVALIWEKDEPGQQDQITYRLLFILVHVDAQEGGMHTCSVSHFLNTEQITNSHHGKILVLFISAFLVLCRENHLSKNVNV